MIVGTAREVENHGHHRVSQMGLETGEWRFRKGRFNTEDTEGRAQRAWRGRKDFTTEVAEESRVSGEEMAGPVEAFGAQKSAHEGQRYIEERRERIGEEEDGTRRGGAGVAGGV